MDHIRIMLADDHQLVRKAFALMLDAQPGMTITGHAANGKELLELIKADQPDVVLLDIDMPIMSGRQSLGIIKLRFPNVKVIMLSLHKDAALMNDCMRNGAGAYLHKDIDMEDLIAAIRSVHTEGVYFNKALSKALLTGVKKEKNSNPFFDAQALSEKEIVVLKELCEGKTNRDIADTLHISVNTVGFHRNNIYTKARCNNMASLMKYAIRNGLVSI